MFKCVTIQEFTLGEFDKLQDIERKAIEQHGKLYVGDKFKCDREMVDYLLGNNAKGKIVAKVIEIIPNK